MQLPVPSALSGFGMIEMMDTFVSGLTGMTMMTAETSEPSPEGGYCYLNMEPDMR